jgi:hypothetical protein
MTSAIARHIKRRVTELQTQRRKSDKRARSELSWLEDYHLILAEDISACLEQHRDHLRITFLTSQVQRSPVPLKRIQTRSRTSHRLGLHSPDLEIQPQLQPTTAQRPPSHGLEDKPSAEGSCSTEEYSDSLSKIIGLHSPDLESQPQLQPITAQRPPLHGLSDKQRTEESFDSTNI